MTRLKSTFTEPERQGVWQMFDRIAERYDLLNHTLSMGIDRRWRHRLAQMLPSHPQLQVLDLATGTADVPLALCAFNADVETVVGMDLAEQMLSKGREKIVAAGLQQRIRLQVGDAMKVPAESNRFDATTISFGIRNVPDLDQTLREMYRLLKPGGYGLVLEFSTPELPGFKQGYLLYLRHILPRLGALISGDSYAYRYLNQTIETFPYGQDFCDRMLAVGFSEVLAEPQTGGIATIYRGIKPHQDAGVITS